MDQPPVYGDRLGDRKPGPAALSHQRRQLRRSAIFTLVAAFTSGNGPCSRRHNVQRLIAAHGPGHEAARSLGATLANCEKARSFNISYQCKAVCEGGSRAAVASGSRGIRALTSGAYARQKTVNDNF